MKNIIYYLLVLPIILFSCSKDSNNDSVENPPVDGTIIGVNGGQVTSNDGIVTLIIPPNALSSDLEISIEKVSNDLPISEGNTAIGDVYKFSPSGLTFNIPIDVKYDYSNITLPNGIETIAALHWNDSNNYEIVGINDFNNNSLTFEINSFSYFSLSDFYDWIYFDNFEGELEWRIFNFKWGISIIKWYADTTVSNSGLSEENLDYALNLWEQETSSFVFERTQNINDANLIFNEYFSEDQISEFGNNCDISFLALSTTQGKMCPNGNLNFGFSVLEAGDNVEIGLASEEIDPDDYISVIAHEIGHALGLGHLNPDYDYNSCPNNLIYPIMARGCTTDTSLFGTIELHEWDIMALYEHYEPAEEGEYFITDFIDFNNNEVPDGWQFSTQNSADISNGRMNAYTTDGVAKLAKQSSVANNIEEIKLEMDIYIAYSYWGLIYNFTISAGNQSMVFRTGQEDYEYPANSIANLVYYSIDNSSSLVDESLTTVDEGVYHVELIIDQNNYTFRGEDETGSEVFSIIVPLLNYISLAEIDIIEFSNIANTDNDGWIDNIRLTVN